MCVGLCWVPAQASKTNAQKCSCAIDAPAPLSHALTAALPLLLALFAAHCRCQLQLRFRLWTIGHQVLPPSLSLSLACSLPASIKSCLCTLINIFILMIFIIAHIRYFLCGREDQSRPQVLYTSASTCCASSLSLLSSSARWIVSWSGALSARQVCQLPRSIALFIFTYYLSVS